MKISLQSMRREYKTSPINEKNLPLNPMELFEKWLKDAIDAEILEPNAMTLSTISLEGRPCSRTVLLKKYSEEGFVFFTNYESRKAIQLNARPYASLLFWWQRLHRQISIEGKVEKIPYEQSDHYFLTRPRGSRIAALTSPQSLTIPSREFLDQKFEELEKEYQGKEIHCPDFWGGFALIPDRFEFWQGQENRLSDRFLYLPSTSGWTLSRLAP